MLNDDDIFVELEENAPQIEVVCEIDIGNFELMHDGKGEDEDE